MHCHNANQLNFQLLLYMQNIKIYKSPDDKSDKYFVVTKVFILEQVN